MSTSSQQGDSSDAGQERRPPHRRSWLEFFAYNASNVLGTATPALSSGAIQAVIFNPYDRALYVRVQTKRKRFLDMRNFEHPFQGFANAAVYRTIVGSSYIFWQDSCRKWIEELGGGPERNPFTHERYPVLYSTTIGVVAGMVNGLALNNLQAIKFRMWTQTSVAPPLWSQAVDLPAHVEGRKAEAAKAARRGFLATARHMHGIGGWAIFFRGIKVTVLRDVVFGVVYEVMRSSARLKEFIRGSRESVTAMARRCRHAAGFGTAEEVMSKRPAREDRNIDAFLLNVFAANCGTIASSPINYYRSLTYGAPLTSKILPISYLLRYHLAEVRYVLHNGHSFYDAILARPRFYYSSVSNQYAEHIDHKRVHWGLKDVLSWTSSAPSSSSRSSSSSVSPSSLARGVALSTDKAPTEAFGRFAHAAEVAAQNAAAARSSHAKHWRELHYYAAWRQLNSRLNIGWGSLRVGLGMAVGQYVFAQVRDAMKA